MQIPNSCCLVRLSKGPSAEKRVFGAALVFWHAPSLAQCAVAVHERKAATSAAALLLLLLVSRKAQRSSNFCNIDGAGSFPHLCLLLHALRSPNWLFDKDLT